MKNQMRRDNRVRKQMTKETKTGHHRKLKVPMNKQGMMTVNKGQIQSICTISVICIIFTVIVITLSLHCQY